MRPDFCTVIYIERVQPTCSKVLLSVSEGTFIYEYDMLDSPGQFVLQLRDLLNPLFVL